MVSQKDRFKFKIIDEEERPFIPSKDTIPEDRRSSTRTWMTKVLSGSSFPWLLFVLLLSFNVFLTVSRETWSSTDFKAARKNIANKLVKFSSSLEFLDEENIYRVFNPEEPKYVGNETEVEKNWDALILPEYNDIKISSAEASGLGGGLWLDIVENKYTIEIEVFHSLHCLNMLRKRIYSHNHPEMLTNNARIHVDHCIEALRELIMCGGDMTPIPVKWSESGNRVNPDFATVHSCRDFEKLREWMIFRGSSHEYSD